MLRSIGLSRVHEAMEKLGLDPEGVTGFNVDSDYAVIRISEYLEHNLDDPWEFYDTDILVRPGGGSPEPVLAALKEMYGGDPKNVYSLSSFVSPQVGQGSWWYSLELKTPEHWIGPNNCRARELRYGAVFDDYGPVENEWRKE